MNYADLVRVTTAATGTGSSITLGAAYSQLFMTPTEAGMLDGVLYSYSIIDGNNFELGRGIYTAAGNSLSRDFVVKARESGTLTNAKLTLSGSAQVRILQLAEDIGTIARNGTIFGTTDTITSIHLNTLRTYNVASAVAVGIGQALTSNGFPSGWSMLLRNTNVGVVTITPSTSTINGAASIALNKDEAVRITSDGTNWIAIYMVRTSVNGQNGNVPIHFKPQIRITLTPNTPVTQTDVTGATALCLEPQNGDQLPIYDGTNWVPVTVAPNTYTLPATQSQNGNRASTANAIITGLTDTSQLIVGMQISGTGIGASSVISTIDSTTQVTGTVNNSATGTGTSVTFKLPPSTNYDVLVINNSNAPKMKWSAAWSNDTTPPARALQDGVLVTSGTATQRVIGSVRTTTIAGQLEDSVAHRWVSNLYNDEPRPMVVNDPAGSWSYSTAGWRYSNGNTANQLDYLVCVARQVQAISSSQPTSTVACNCITGIGIDGIASNAAQISQSPTVPASGQSVNLLGYYAGTPGIGRHTLVWMEYGGGTGTQTWFGTTAPWVKMGIVGAVSN